MWTDWLKGCSLIGDSVDWLFTIYALSNDPILQQYFLLQVSIMFHLDTSEIFLFSFCLWAPSSNPHVHHIYYIRVWSNHFILVSDTLSPNCWTSAAPLICSFLTLSVLIVINEHLSISSSASASWPKPPVSEPYIIAALITTSDTHEPCISPFLFVLNLTHPREDISSWVYWPSYFWPPGLTSTPADSSLPAHGAWPHLSVCPSLLLYTSPLYCRSSLSHPSLPLLLF